MKLKVHPVFWFALACLLFWYLVVSCVLAHCDSFVNVEALTRSIWLAEGGNKTSHPYGILKHYKTTTPKQACINTINHALRDYEGEPNAYAFIRFLGSRYCPIGAKNDPKGLNVNWIHNVTHFYIKEAGL